MFVPTIEIARITSHYKNSLLLYNPRSYLEFEGEKVNSAIRDTILSSRSNDFALLNNGITIVCDESNLNEQSGQRGRARMYLLNPQIINGGQTAFTLSRIYEKLSDTEREEIFSGKEVLVKAIALTKTSGQEDDDSSRVALIERISTATNSQSVVTLADRTSGDPLHTNIQKALFDRFGLLYERKRGEFAGALRDGYIWQEDVINRAIFARLFLTATGRLKSAIRRRVLAEPLGSLPITEAAQLDRFIIAYKAFEVLRAGSGHLSNRRYSEILPKVHASLIVASELNNEIEVEHRGLVAANIVQDRWPSFLSFAAKPWPQV